MAPEHLCEHYILVQIRSQRRKMAAFSQLGVIDPDASTKDANGDWHYWIAQGHCVQFTHGHRKLTV